jgi:hypothetical protein
MTQTAAHVMRAAVAELRSCPQGDDPAVPGGAIPSAIADPLAEWLTICARYADKWGHHAPVSPFQEGGLAVARALLGTAPAAGSDVEARTCGDAQ